MDKREISLVSTLSSIATLKIFATFNVIVCCYFTSVAMSIMPLLTVLVKISINLSPILKIMQFCLMNHQTTCQSNWELENPVSKRSSVVSKAVSNFVVTFRWSVFTTNLLLENAALLWDATYCLQCFDLLSIVREGFFELCSKKSFYVRYSANDLYTIEGKRSSVSSRNKTEISVFVKLFAVTGREGAWWCYFRGLYFCKDNLFIVFKAVLILKNLFTERNCLFVSFDWHFSTPPGAAETSVPHCTMHAIDIVGLWFRG